MKMGFRQCYTAFHAASLARTMGAVIKASEGRKRVKGDDEPDHATMGCLGGEGGLH
jgi:hypothetical protein